MNTQYHGKNVTIVRNVKPGDDGFDAAKAQVIIKLSDGTQQTVSQSDVVTA